MARIVIFGTRDFASLAHFYLTHDSQHEVVAFTVSREYLPESPTLEGLPVVPFEELEERYPPEQVSALAPMSPRKMNSLRKAIYDQFRQRGYELISYISSKATTFAGFAVKDNCFILEDNTIQPFVEIGANVVLWSGNHIGHHSVIRDHAFITSHVVVSGHCTIEESAFLGVNATIRDGLRIGEGSLIGMGACVTRDTRAWSVVRGNPAREGNMSSMDVDL